MGERGLSYTEALNTPVRDLFMLRDIMEELDKMKQKIQEEQEGGERSHDL